MYQFGGTIESGEGSYGDWIGWTDCEKFGVHKNQTYLTSFSLQVEGDQVPISIIFLIDAIPSFFSIMYFYFCSAVEVNLSSAFSVYWYFPFDIYLNTLVSLYSCTLVGGYLYTLS